MQVGQPFQVADDHIHLGEALQVVQQHRGQHLLPEQQRHAYREPAARFEVQPGGRGFGFPHLQQQPLAVAGEALPGFGQRHALGAALQQGQAQALLQCLHGAGHGGRRQPQLARGGGQAQGLADGEEGLHLPVAVHVQGCRLRFRAGSRARRSVQKSTKVRTLAAIRRPPWYTTWIGSGGCSKASRTISSSPRHTLSATW